MQLKLLEVNEEKIKEAKKIVTEEKERKQGIYKCNLCEKKGKIGEDVFWINGGCLYLHNFYAHPDCYIKDLKNKFKFVERGFKDWNGNIEIFSQTTGWERIKIEDVESLTDDIMGNPIFPYVVILKDNTFGITEECKNYLENKGIKYKRLTIKHLPSRERR